MTDHSCHSACPCHRGSAPFPDLVSAYDDLAATAEKHGYTIDNAYGCPIQGVIISYSRAVKDGETFLGIPVHGERTESEVIERHYCPEIEAPPEVEEITWRRALQRVLWDMAADTAPPNTREQP